MCYNPIFTPRIFSGVDTQNETARTKPARAERDSVTLENSHNMARSTFLKVWGGLTKFDQS
jgi:hypothetical protein